MAAAGCQALWGEGVKVWGMGREVVPNKRGRTVETFRAVAFTYSARGAFAMRLRGLRGGHSARSAGGGERGSMISVGYGAKRQMPELQSGPGRLETSATP